MVRFRSTGNVRTRSTIFAGTRFRTRTSNARVMCIHGVRVTCDSVRFFKHEWMWKEGRSAEGQRRGPGDFGGRENRIVRVPRPFVRANVFTAKQQRPRVRFRPLIPPHRSFNGLRGNIIMRPRTDDNHVHGPSVRLARNPR